MDICGQERTFKTWFYVLERWGATTEAREASGVGICSTSAVNTTVAVKTAVAGRWDW